MTIFNGSNDRLTIERKNTFAKDKHLRKHSKFAKPNFWIIFGIYFHHKPDLWVIYTESDKMYDLFTKM